MENLEPSAENRKKFDSDREYGKVREQRYMAKNRQPRNRGRIIW